MTLSELVHETFAPNKEWHRLFMVWLQCWMEARHGRLGRTNGDIAKATGLQRTHVRKCLGVLRDLGLVNARRTHGNSGFDLILVTRNPTPTVIEALRDVATGRLVIDLKVGEVREASTGGRRDVACRPVLEIQHAPGVWFVETENQQLTNGTDLANITTEYSNSVTKVLTQYQQDHSNNAIPDHSERAAGQAQPTAPDLAQELAALRRTLDDQADKKAKASEAARKAKLTKVTPQSPEEEAALLEVFPHWQRAMGYADENLTQERKAVILARLRAGFTVEQLKRIIDWASTDEWCRGRAARSTRPFDDFKNLMNTDKMANEKLHIAKRGSRSITNAPSLLGTPGKGTTARKL